VWYRAFQRQEFEQFKDYRIDVEERRQMPDRRRAKTYI